MRQKHSAPKFSRTRRPDDLSLDDWQRGLRKQFGQEQKFKFQNIGEQPVFSEYRVANPQSKRSYKVAIRGRMPGENFCACPDFATNALGTCKHIEFMLARLAKQRGGKAALAEGFHPPYSEVFLEYGAERRVRLRVGAECPSTLLPAARRLFDATNRWALRDNGAADVNSFVKLAANVGHELRCYDDALAFLAQARDADARERALAAAYPRGAESAALRKLLKVPLYPYQAEGALFAARVGRVLIGDEMGLGKTIQAIAAAELLRKHSGAEGVLIICPTSVKQQWRNEIKRFTDQDAQVVEGGYGLRAKQYADATAIKIVNYDVIARDLHAIQRWSPDIVIVDEAQRIKNWNTIAARALKQISSPYAIVLTGTPLENRLEELISIVQFVDQHRLGPTWRLLHEHQSRDDAGRVIGYRNLDRIGKTLTPILIRRRKAEVLKQLPKRIDNTFFVAMTDEQRAHHDDNGAIVKRIVSRWRKTGFLSDADQKRLTCSLQNMRMSCNSTYLLDEQTDHGRKADELIDVLDDIFEDPTAKAVVFSQWVRTHKVILKRLAERNWGHVLFHGGVPSAQRGALVDRFRDDPECRLFLSTDAGGVGLNLQHAAATIVNMDLPWNPAVLEQRIGRVHRLGQTRAVQVVNFVAEHTIEHGMLSVLAFKKSLFAGVLDGGESEIFMNGTRLSKFMESVDEVTSAVTPAVPTGETAYEDNAATISAPTISQAQDENLSTSISPTQEPKPSNATGEAWSALIDVGLKLFESLATSSRDTSNGDVAKGNGARGNTSHVNKSFAIETDQDTGRSVLKLALPPPETLQRATRALSSLLESMR